MSTPSKQNALSATALMLPLLLGLAPAALGAGSAAADEEKERATCRAIYGDKFDDVVLDPETNKYNCLLKGQTKPEQELEPEIRPSCSDAEKKHLAKSGATSPSEIDPETGKPLDFFTDHCEFQGDYQVCTIIAKKTPGCSLQKAVKYGKSASGKCEEIQGPPLSSATLACKSEDSKMSVCDTYVFDRGALKNAVPTEPVSRDAAFSRLKEYESDNDKAPGGDSYDWHLKGCEDGKFNFKCTWYLGSANWPKCVSVRSYLIRKDDKGVCHVSPRIRSETASPQVCGLSKDPFLVKAPECRPADGQDPKADVVAIDPVTSGGEEYCQCPKDYGFSKRDGKPYCVKQSSSCGKYKIKTADGGCECPLGFTPAAPGAAIPCTCPSPGKMDFSGTAVCYNEQSCAQMGEGLVYKPGSASCSKGEEVVTAVIDTKGGSKDSIHTYDVKTKPAAKKAE